MRTPDAEGDIVEKVFLLNVPPITCCPSSKVHLGQKCIMNSQIELLLGFVLGRTESPATMRIRTIFQGLQLPKVAGPRPPTRRIKKRCDSLRTAYSENAD
jgi:hypothetical protein